MKQETKTSCAWVVDNLSAYIDGELSDLERAAVRRHLRGCKVCQAETTEVIAIQERIRRVRASLPREIFNRFIDFLLWTQPEAPAKGKVEK